MNATPQHVDLPSWDSPGGHIPDVVMPDHLDAAQEKHRLRCALCQRRVARASSRADTLEDASDDDFAAAMAARFAQQQPPALALPAAVARSLFDQGTPPEIGPDQVWQLRWQSEVCLVATVAVNSWHVTVSPVTTDVHLTGADSAVVDAGSSPLQVPTAVWLSVTATVPMAAFARAIGAFAWPAGSGVLREALRSVRRTGSVGSATAHGVQGQESNIDTIEITDVLQHNLAWFASADRVLTETLNATGDSTQTVDVVPLLRRLSSTQLAKAGVRKAELIPVIRGGQLTAVQASALAPILGLDPASLLGGGPAAPEQLIEEASSPRWFHPRRAFSRANEMSDVDGLADITSKAQFALAARAPGVAPDATNWRSKVAWVLADYLDEDTR